MGRLADAIKFLKVVDGKAKDVKEAKDTITELRGVNKKEIGRKAGRLALNEGAETGKTALKTFLKTYEVIPRTIGRVSQFVLALVVCGFYGNRVAADREAGDGYSAEWIFAVLIGGTAAVTAALFGLAAPLGALPYIGGRTNVFKTYRAYAWDWFLCVMWFVVFAIFAVIFLHRDSDDKYKGSSTGLMKTAMWVDMVNGILWFVSGLWGFAKTRIARRADHLQQRAVQKTFGPEGPEP